jgi:SSS family solute:Na+ symporter
MDTTVISITGIYIAFIFVIGVLTSRRIGSSDDFLVAGRNVGWFFLACTMGATAVGGGYSIGAVGKTYELGLLMVLASLGGYLQFVFSGLFIAPKVRGAEVFTVAGYMGKRFGQGPRRVALVLSLLFSLFIIAAQMAAIGHVVTAMLPDSSDPGYWATWAIVLGGLVVVIYSTAGGLKAVILTDAFQFFVLLAGFGITAALVLPEVMSDGQATFSELPRFFFEPTGGKGPIYLGSLFLAFLLGETFAPGYVTRFCSGKSSFDLRLGIGGVGVLLTLLMPALVFLIAAYARVRFPDIEPGQAMAAVITHLNHPIIAGLIIAALLSAVMSSADSALNSATAIFIKDIFEPAWGTSRLNDRQTLRLARGLTALLGILSIAAALVMPDIIEQLLFAYHIWAPGMIVPVVVAAMTRLDGPRVRLALTISMIIGPLAAMSHKALRGAVYERGPMPQWIGEIDPAIFGVVICAAMFTLLLILLRTDLPNRRHGRIPPKRNLP